MDLEKEFKVKRIGDAVRALIKTELHNVSNNDIYEIACAVLDKKFNPEIKKEKTVINTDEQFIQTIA